MDGLGGGGVFVESSMPELVRGETVKCGVESGWVYLVEQSLEGFFIKSSFPFSIVGRRFRADVGRYGGCEEQKREKGSERRHSYC